MPLFYLTVREHAYTGRFYDDVVEAGSFEEALQLAAGRAAAPRPPGARPQPDDADRRRCADVWVYSLLHCELAQGHDPPHMAAATGYRHAVRWVRDDRGLAHALPEPASRPPALSPVAQLPSAPEGDSSQVPLTGQGGARAAGRSRAPALARFRVPGQERGVTVIPLTAGHTRSRPVTCQTAA
jgi:hypothetical protein